jgi:hypothetical protein
MKTDKKMFTFNLGKSSALLARRFIVENLIRPIRVNPRQNKVQA